MDSKHVYAVTGQLFILHTIKNFGALIFAAVMTTRQFLSILVSSILFNNRLSEGQWYASLSASACDRRWLTL